MQRRRWMYKAAASLCLLLLAAPGLGLPAPVPADVAFAPTGEPRNGQYSEYCGGHAQGSDQSCSVGFTANPAASVYILYCTSACAADYRTSGIIENVLDHSAGKGVTLYQRAFHGGEPLVCAEYSYAPPNHYNRMNGTATSGDLNGCLVDVTGKWGVAVSHAGFSNR